MSLPSSIVPNGHRVLTFSALTRCGSGSIVVHGEATSDINPLNIARRAENMARNAVVGFAKVADAFTSQDAMFVADLKEFFLVAKLAGREAAMNALMSRRDDNPPSSGRNETS